MKKICKKCGMEVSGKFCSECGSKFELSIQEQLEEMSHIIEKQNEIIQGLQRQKKVIINDAPITRKRQKSMTIEEKLRNIIKYVKNNKFDKFTISEAYKKALNSKDVDGKSLVELKNIISSRNIPGIRYEANRYRFYIFTKHYKEEKNHYEVRKNQKTKRVCSEKELELRRKNPFLKFKSKEWNNLPPGLSFYQKNKLLAERWNKEKKTKPVQEHKVDTMLKKKAYVPKDFDGIRKDAFYGSKTISEEELVFPEIKYLDNQGLKLFEQVLINTIANKSTIELHTVRYSIPLINNQEWTGHIWVEFCKDVASKRQQIAKALNVGISKIKVCTRNGYWVISGGY